MTLAIDTSVSVPLLARNHPAHSAVVRWWNGQELTLSGHAFVETYAVLTRLPGDARLDAADAARLIKERFAPPLVLSEEAVFALPQTLSRLGIAGGAVYDAMVALAAKEHAVALATRDARARGTYEAVGVKTVIAV